MNESELDFLNSYYKEVVHGTFITDAESTRLFKEAKRLSLLKRNVEFYDDNGFYPEEVTDAVEAFNRKSKSLGNLIYDFWEQREINSDDYKRRHDIQNNVSVGLQLESFEDIQYMSDIDEDCETRIEDLITESEE